MLLNIQTGPYPRDWALIVFNPLRKRAPERVAESFLERLRSGEYDLALSGVHTSAEVRQSIVQGESRAPLTRWRLIERKDNANVSVLTYAFPFQNNSGEGLLYIGVERIDGKWKMKYYDRMY